MPHTEYQIKTEPLGRPHLQCAKCRMAVIWPDGLTAEKKAAFASVVRENLVQGISFAETHFGLGAREAKVLVLHVTRKPGECHKCGKPVVSGESLCACRSVNLDW